MWQLATRTVDRNSRYSYLLLAEYFGDTCVVASDGASLLGFATGFAPPADPDALFIWQIAVAPEGRGRGIGSELLEQLVARARPSPFRFLEATVTPDNVASKQLFASFAARRAAPLHEELLFDRADFEGEHEPELRLRIGPF